MREYLDVLLVTTILIFAIIGLITTAIVSSVADSVAKFDGCLHGAAYVYMAPNEPLPKYADKKVVAECKRYANEESK